MQSESEGKSSNDTFLQTQLGMSSSEVSKYLQKNVKFGLEKLRRRKIIYAAK